MQPRAYITSGTELLFKLMNQRYEHGAKIITWKPGSTPGQALPVEEWTGTCGDKRLTVALLDRLNNHMHILKMNSQSYRLNQSRARRGRTTA